MLGLPWTRFGSLRDAIRTRYAESGADQYGIDADGFERHVMAVVERYALESAAWEQMALVKSLHVGDLVLARACSAGNDRAWDTFLTRFREELYRVAGQITRDDAAGRELAGEIYAELFGLPDPEGRRVSKLDYYMGRGCLVGWLRAVIAQKHVDHCRRGARNVSLEEQVEHGVGFASAAPAEYPANPDPVNRAVSAALAQCTADERLLLATYFLDGRTLAQIGRQLGVHESTISRKLNRLTTSVRKRVRGRLLKSGVNPARCDELLAELDVRDLNVDVGATLRQEKGIGTF